MSELPRRRVLDELSPDECREILQARLTRHSVAWIERQFNVHRRSIRAIVDRHISNKPTKAEPHETGDTQEAEDLPHQPDPNHRRDAQHDGRGDLDSSSHGAEVIRGDRLV